MKNEDRMLKWFVNEPIYYHSSYSISMLHLL